MTVVQLRFCAYQYANLPIEVLVTRWLRAEELGFDVIWNCDTLNEPDVPGAAMFEATSILAAMATSTTRIRVGTLVNTLVYRNPAVVAKTAMTIDHLSNGRLELGFGGGVLESDHRASGIAWWDAAERVARFGEAIQIIDQMLRNDRTTWAGRFYKVEDADMVPTPIQRPRPPITIPAHGPMMLRVAAQFADSWSSWGGSQIETEAQMFAVTRERCARFGDLCISLNRDPKTIRHSLVCYPPLTPWESVQHFVDMIGRYRELGIDEFVLYWPNAWRDTPDETVAFETITAETIPELRREAT